MNRATQEDDILFYQVSREEKERYNEAAEAALTKESYLEEIHSAAEQFMGVAENLLTCVEPGSGNPVWGQMRLSTTIAEVFYDYALEGNASFLYTYEEGSKRELTEEDLFDFGMLLSSFLAYNEMFSSLEESMGGAQRAYSMYVVLNMFFARLKLDASRYSSQELYLSIAEVALLARMKEKSVRNYAHRSMGAIHIEAKRMTLIPAANALEWLQSRRKFTPSKGIETPYAKDLLVSMLDEFGN